MGDTTEQIDALPPSVRFVTLKQLMDSGFTKSRMTLWRAIKNGELPPPIRFLGRLGWRESTLKRCLKNLEDKAG